jgi:acyl-coenzyme A synthetase/AMP-(fatty) acid ligase
MNFTIDVIGKRERSRTGLIEIGAGGRRRSWTFGELDDRAARKAAGLHALGVRRGDVVMTVCGSCADWIFALLGAWRLGAVALPCVEQSRAEDVRQRAEAVEPRVALVASSAADEVQRAGLDCPILGLDDDRLAPASADSPGAELASDDPALIIFTSGTSGRPKPVVHGVRYLLGQRLQARAWLDARPGDRVWCTAAAGWSKSARNSFVAPWLSGATALVHTERFHPDERLELLVEERPSVLCMSPTEYRLLLHRTELRPLPALRSAVAAGEHLDEATVEAWHDATGVAVRDGFGQSETGAVTGVRPGEWRPGSMGRPLPGVRVQLIGGQLAIDPDSLPTFFLGYCGGDPPAGPWHTGDLVDRDEEGFLWYRGRADDVIISSGYRIDPLEVEQALNSHPAVAESAVVGEPDEERGQVVRAVVVLAAHAPTDGRLTRALQDYVKRTTAPYKYPRIVDVVERLPRTASGKLQRASLRR